MMIAIVNYDTGNIRSVANALARVGCTDWVYTDDKHLLTTADKVILPGVGEASTAMAKLAERGLDTLIPTLTQPVLGICVGTQLMCQSSEEGNAECMGIFRTKVRKFQPEKQQDGQLSIVNCTLSIEKVPHMGWNQITNLRTPLFNHIDDGAYIYYVHSYYPELCDDTIATSHYINAFSGALGRDNFFGTQFHPEKSGSVGAQILKNFLEL
ncbi:MAG: imidazole glycerol phosphate synthase subunit HisH [Bacteroidaceae bacterium]|nr:imidazole glycerol phosphate synthase subunit HisH [Bacteroidaceae bacterium]